LSYLRLGLLLGFIVLTQNSFGLTCEATIDRHAVKISPGPVNFFHPNKPSNKIETIEIYGDGSFYQQLENGWVFALVRQEFGWSLRLREDESTDAVDLSALTPPYYGAPNPRDIAGWHFRNKNNSGPNKGDVNAPQELRLFNFSGSLAATGGFKPSTDGGSLRLETPAKNEGRGWLEIIDYGLNGAANGESAKMNYLKFAACLTWPKTKEEARFEQDLASAEYTAEDLEQLGACGLDMDLFELQATRLPRNLAADFDGDDVLDKAVQVRRISDGRRGIAICRAGTWLDLFGYSILKSVKPHADYLQQVGSWELVAADHGSFGFDDEAPWPEADGQILILDRVEKARTALYWISGSFHFLSLYNSAEP